MNIVDIIIILIVFLMTVWGFKKGFFVSLMGIIKYVVGVPLGYFVAQNYYKIVYKNYVYDRLLQKVNEKINGAQNLDTFVSSLKTELAKLPPSIAKGIDLSTLSGAKKATVAKFVMDNMVEPVAYIVIEIALFILTFIVFALICSIICAIVKSKKDKESFVCKTNSVLGGLFGFAKSILFVLLFAAIVNYLNENADISSKNEVMRQINNSALLEYINQLLQGINKSF